VRLSPNDLAALDVYGRILAGQGKVPEAIAQFEHALRVDPNFAPAREALRTLRGGY
jgi:cytochrome c-type biogenesis protein CcmH/NrfG